MRATDAAIAATAHEQLSFGYCAQDPQPCALTGVRTCWRATLPDGSIVPLAEAECTAAGWKKLQAAVKGAAARK